MHNGNLVVESKDRNSDHSDYIYHKLSVPKEVDFKTIQTKVVGDKLIVSADKHIGEGLVIMLTFNSGYVK